MCAAISENRRLTTRDKHPCYGCEKRYPACQDKCPDMAAAKKANEERKAVERRKRLDDNCVKEYSIQRQLHAQRKKMRER